MTNGDTPVADPSLTRPAKRGAMVRFVWQTDRAGQFHFPDAIDAVAALIAQYDGHFWPKGDMVGDALAAHITFVGVETRVPLQDNKATRLVLSGTPVIGSDGAFDGFRGFGFMEAPMAQAAAPARLAIEPKQTSVPIQAVAMGLSASERQAFRDIARALGARPDDDLESEEPPALPSDAVTLQAPTPELVTAPPTSERMAEILDRLPLGILISRGGVPIVMNRPLLDWLGYDSIDGFHDAGGIDTMFGGRDPSRRSSDDEGAMLLRALGVKLQTLQWDDLPASMMLFEPIGTRDDAVNPYDSETNSESSGVSVDELSAILDTATDGVIVLNRDGRILSLNRSAEAVFEFDTAEIIGERFTSLLAEDSRARAIDYLEGLKDNGVASVLNDGREVMGQTRDGGRLPLFMTMGRIGTLAEPKYCAVLRDITTFKRAERDFIEARRAAETASARKSDFLARISHEIRTPLSAIIGFAEIMHDERFGQLGNARYRDYLKDILNSGAHVLDLVNDLLDLSKIEAGRADLTFGEVDINAVLLNAANVLQETANKGSVVVRLSLTSHLPSIVADERSLTQITLNILSNAIKFTPEGGQVIVSTARTAEGEVAIRVKDTGVGMSEADIAMALEPFRQVSTTRKSGGTGLGLPLTKALVEANRASMAIRSARNTGTLVEIVFPPTRVLADR
jgi:PAS domain S-box-containing protein